jgi:signal transduction histidine kinase/ActR/RegA family two-component response regulator
MNAAAVKVQPLRVVVIDDTEDLRQLLRIALERGGMQIVGEAGDGAAGIEVVRDALPDVVLLDLSMPVMDGLEALPHLRRIAPEAKIIVLSGFGASQMAERAVASGADGYLQKGMPLGQILDQVQEIADGPEPAPPPRALHVVPEPGAAVWDALALSPYGVLEVDGVAPFQIIHANPAATALLDDETLVGRSLDTAAGEIAALARTHLTTGQPALTATVGGRPIRVTFRHASRSLLLYLEPSQVEIEQLRRTVAATAHEIRGPVAVLNALADTMRHHDPTDTDQRDELLSSVARQARVLDGLTGDLLVTAQVERGMLRIERQPVDPVAVAEAVISDQQVQVDLEVLDGRRVLADPLRLDQMLGNLVRNAVKHGGPPIVIRIRDHDEEHLLAIDVQDHGIGVPEDFRSRMFQEFARAAGTTVSGFGLGLHVVRTLAEAHGGSVSYAPGPTGGAIFTLVLPVADPD